jgi:hypothetical protein
MAMKTLVKHQPKALGSGFWLLGLENQAQVRGKNYKYISVRVYGSQESINVLKKVQV